MKSHFSSGPPNANKDREMSAVLQLCRHQGRPRQWIAAAAAFALALQLLLSSAGLGQLTAWHTGIGDAFAICHGAGESAPGDRNGPAQQQDPQSHCILCTLRSSGCAVLPTTSPVATFVQDLDSRPLFALDAQVTEHHSPTGEYQRGPPLYGLGID
jgi:hypothetical protein